MGADITQLLNDVRSGRHEASDQLMRLVHDELRRMAEGKMLDERAGHTLQPTALVHEAYLRLFGAGGAPEDRAHFFGAAARAMQHVLIEHAREKGRLKRGGGAIRVTLHDESAPAPYDADVIEIRDAIEALEDESAEMADLVRQRYFAGLTLEEIATVRGVSLATVKRRWRFVRVWLFERLGAS